MIFVVHLKNNKTMEVEGDHLDVVSDKVITLINGQGDIIAAFQPELTIMVVAKEAKKTDVTQ